MNVTGGCAGSLCKAIVQGRAHYGQFTGILAQGASYGDAGRLMPTNGATGTTPDRIMTLNEVLSGKTR